MRLHLLFAAPALLLVACPPTSTCPAGQMWNGSSCVPSVDTGPFDGGRDANGEDAPCGGGCAAPLVCNFDTNECVECLGTDASSCTDAGDNACVDSTCVACDDDVDCEGLDAAQCNTTTNTCEACTSDAACAGRTGTEVCNAGTCVECSADDESACTAGVCDVQMGTCTNIPERTAVVCRGCVNDRQCADGQLCVPSEFPAGTVIGNVCAWRQDASVPGGPMGMCGRVRPYIGSRMATSVNGVRTQVCTPRVSTCEAFADFSMTPCGPAGTTPNPMCGAADVDDGFCRNDSSLGDRCTVGCTSNDDCPCRDGTCARQYRCNLGFCEFDCNCAVGSSACMLLSGEACL